MISVQIGIDIIGDFQNNRKNHFISIFYQIKDIIRYTDIKSVLEFGTGGMYQKLL